MPFSPKQREYIHRCSENIFNIAEGAVRSGKTICNVLAFAFALEYSPDRLHLATGVTLSAACLNIGDCNGFGLEHLFRGRCRWGKYKGSTCLNVDTETGRKTVIFAGGGKADSYKKIRGASYGMWIATEINKHYISPDDDCFIKEAFNRQLAAADRRIFWDLNPDYPSHPVYSDYVDKYREDKRLKVNYMKFTMRDNFAVTEDRRREIEAQYDPHSVWYRRSILGERVTAEGLIFKSFADDPQRYTVDRIPEDIAFISVGCDYGGNLSKTAFVAAAVRNNGKGVCIVDARKVDGEKGTVTPDRIEAEFVRFISDVTVKFGHDVRYAFADSEGQYLTAGLIRAAAAAGLTVRVSDCRKIPIMERISAKARLISEGKWTVLSNCRQVIESTASQTWDPNHPDRRLDNGTADIDTADAEEYAWERFISYMTN